MILQDEMHYMLPDELSSIKTNMLISAKSRFCQVKVLSDPEVEVGDEHLVNLAYQKPTSQSSTGWGGVPARAVDGKESGQWSK